MDRHGPPASRRPGELRSPRSRRSAAMNHRYTMTLACAALLAGAPAAWAQQKAPAAKAPTSAAAAKAPAEVTLLDHVRARTESILKVLSDNGDFTAAAGQLQQLFDVCVAY